MKTAIMLGKKRCSGYNILRSGTRGVWEFNEILGSTAGDETGGNVPLEKSGTYTNGQPGATATLTPCIQLDGITGKMEMLIIHPVLSPQAAHSISMWFNKTANSLTSKSGLVCHSGSNLASIAEYEVILHNSNAANPNRIEASYWDTNDVQTTVVYDPPSDIWVGAWNNVVYTRDGNVMKLYVNKIEVATNTGGNGSMQQSGAGYPYTFGCTRYTLNDDFLNGYIDQTAMWMRPLDENDLCYLYNLKKGLPYTRWLS